MAAALPYKILSDWATWKAQMVPTPLQLELKDSGIPQPTDKLITDTIDKHGCRFASGTQLVCGGPGTRIVVKRNCQQGLDLCTDAKGVSLALCAGMQKGAVTLHVSILMSNGKEYREEITGNYLAIVAAPTFSILRVCFITRAHNVMWLMDIHISTQTVAEGKSATAAATVTATAPVVATTLVPSDSKQVEHLAKLLTVMHDDIKNMAQSNNEQHALTHSVVTNKEMKPVG